MFPKHTLAQHNLSYKVRLIPIVALIFSSIIFVANLQPIPQDPDYHLFADKSIYLNIPNTANFLSNAAFVIAGIAGLLRFAKKQPSIIVNMWRFFFTSIILVGFGSAYYHWFPSTTTLFWDRLPMALAFSSLSACLITERFGTTPGRLTFILLTIAGATSVFYWSFTESMGFGDLRLYILTQYLPMLTTPMILLLFPKEPAYNRPYWILLFGYALAKAFEMQDITIFEATHHLISGHTIKHIVAATAIGLFKPKTE